MFLIPILGTHARIMYVTQDAETKDQKRIIHVTQDAEAKDQNGCGSHVLPCRRIKYAVNKSKPFDIILIDGGSKVQYEYNLNETLLIEKELTLASYKSHQNPNIKIDLKSERDYTSVAPFKISKNFGLSSLNFYLAEISGNLEVNLLAMFRSNINVTLNNCTIKYVNRLFSFTNTGIIGQINVHIQDCIIEEIYPGLEGLMKPSSHSALKVTQSNTFHNKIVVINVLRCIFANAETDLCNLKNCIVYIKRTKFNNSCLYSGYGIKTDISENSTFLKSVLAHIPERQFNSSSLILQDASFTGSRVLETGEVAVQIMIYRCPNVTIKNCLFRKSTGSVLLAVDSLVNITNSRFVNNQQVDKGLQVSVVHILRSSAFISGCSFDNNTSPLAQGGTLRFDGCVLDYKIISIINTSIKGGIQSKSESFENSLVSISATDAIKFLHHVNISCPVNYKLIYTFGSDNFSFQVFCKKCLRNTYSLNFESITWNETKSSFDYQAITCTECPYEAICHKRIQSKGNYWGYETENKTVKFVYCPISYCCISPSSCSSYNTCSPKRHGILCSKCLRNYSVGLFGYNRCIPSASCSKFYFWIIYLFLTVFCTLFFMYMQEIFLLIKRILQKLACYRDVILNDINEIQQDEDNNLLSANADELPFQLVLHSSANVMEHPEQKYQISGIIKILFFFYQTALIIRINSHAKGQFVFPEFADILLSFFNVKIDINSTYIKICPFKNSDTISVEIIRSGISIICPFILFLIAVSCLVYERILSRILPFQQLIVNEADSRYCICIDDRVPHHAKLPFLVRIKSAYIQVLLIGYASIAVLLFKTINCIDINGEKHLYIEASIICYTKLQKIFIFIIANWVIPFCISLYMSCYLLRNCKITPNEFIFINTFPPSILIYALRSKLRRNNSSLSLKNAMVAKAILCVVNQPFKSISDKSIKIQWESVLILRRLLLIIVNTFLISPFEKLYPIGFLLVLYLIHHMIVQPYKDFSLNIAEGMSLTALCFLTLLNNFWAFSIEIDVTKSFKTSGYIFIYLELVILLIPLLTCFSILLMILVKKCVCQRTGHSSEKD